MISDEQLRTIYASVMRHRDNDLSFEGLRQSIDAALGHTRMVEEIKRMVGWWDACGNTGNAHASNCGCGGTSDHGNNWCGKQHGIIENMRTILADHAGEVGT